MKKSLLLVFVFVLLFGGIFSSGILNYFNKDSNEVKQEIANAQPNIQEPTFKQEGELEFVRIKEKLTIEIADNEQEIQQGLMFRRSMPDSCGMLFIMPEYEPQSFWMKNTYIPLDIIFLDEQKRIVTIQANRVPFSEESVPSYENAKYVLEVNAGYCIKKAIEKGDVLKF